MATKKTAKNAPIVKTLEELKTDLQKAVSDHSDARRSHAQGELVNPHILNTHRKAIARIKTAINAFVPTEVEGKESK
jgi:large subunit ribosomal protein L29